jgi:hypothetical protein
MIQISNHPPLHDPSPSLSMQLLAQDSSTNQPVPRDPKPITDRGLTRKGGLLFSWHRVVGWQQWRIVGCITIVSLRDLWGSSSFLVFRLWEFGTWLYPLEREIRVAYPVKVKMWHGKIDVPWLRFLGEVDLNGDLSTLSPFNQEQSQPYPTKLHSSTQKPDSIKTARCVFRHIPIPRYKLPVNSGNGSANDDRCLEDCRSAFPNLCLAETDCIAGESISLGTKLNPLVWTSLQYQSSNETPSWNARDVNTFPIQYSKIDNPQSWTLSREMGIYARWL